jgi:hypothetical protein
MKSNSLPSRLQQFRESARITGKGALAVVLHVTRYARDYGLPLHADDLITEGSGQVLGLGKGAIQKILADHGIMQVLAEEGGRTSRGSIGVMKSYVAFLNELHGDRLADLNAVEVWWVERVREFFSAKPFRLRYDAALSMQEVLNDLLDQARKRQKSQTGTMYHGAMLQHLVGAKLEIAMPSIRIGHNGFSVADSSTSRAGDFIIDDAVIHVTVKPSLAVVEKCKRNLDAGLRPIIVTVREEVLTAHTLTGALGVAVRIDIIDASSFLSTNLYELSLFRGAARRETFEKLIETYNKIVAEVETDPSLRIDPG